MLGYIYCITNKINKKTYVGLTVQNFDTRIKQHLKLLRNNEHHSSKMQEDYNKYGETNFEFSSIAYEVKDILELAELERQKIEEKDSFKNGYNMTQGGECGKSKINDETKSLIYHLCKKYKGIYHKLSGYFSYDRTTIKSIALNDNLNNIDYDINKFNYIIKVLDITKDNLTENYILPTERKLNNEQCLELLSVIMQIKGYDKIMCKIFDITSKVTYRLKNGEIYKDCLEKFNSMSKEEQIKLKEQTFKKYKLEEIRAKKQRKGVKNPLTQEQVNYILDNKDKKSKAQIARDLGISPSRVGAVCNGTSYKDLIKNYTALYKSQN